MVTVTNDIVVILHSNSNHVTDKGKRAFKIVLKKTQECFEITVWGFFFLKLKKNILKPVKDPSSKLYSGMVIGATTPLAVAPKVAGPAGGRSQGPKFSAQQAPMGSYYPPPQQQM